MADELNVDSLIRRLLEGKISVFNFPISATRILECFRFIFTNKRRMGCCIIGTDTLTYDPINVRLHKTNTN